MVYESIIQSKFIEMIVEFFFKERYCVRCTLKVRAKGAEWLRPRQNGKG
jgi:hypothetical protein